MGILKKIGIGVGVVFAIIIVLGIVATFTSTGRVAEIQPNFIEPKKSFPETEEIEVEEKIPQPVSSKNIITIAEQCKKCSQHPQYGTLCRYGEDCLYGLANTAEDCRNYEQLPYLSQGGRRDVKFDDSYVEKCIMKVALRLNNTGLCNELQLNKCWVSEVNKCNCYLGIALNQNKPSICNSLNDVEKFDCLKGFMTGKELVKTCGDKTNNLFYLRESCIVSKLEIKLSGTLENDVNTCLQIFDEKYQPKIEREGCIEIVAILQKDLDVCDQAGKQRVNCYVVMTGEYDFVKLTDCDKLGVDYQGCYFSVAIRIFDTSICEKLTTYAKDECLKEIALKTNNVLLCSRLQENNEQKYCANIIYNRVKDNLTVNVCDAGAKIQNLEWAEECYFTVAKKTLDISLCEKSGRYKEECEIIISHALNP